MARVKSGEAGEQAALWFFQRAGWRMFRTQPPVRILAFLGGDSPLGRAVMAVVRKYLPSLVSYGPLVLGRLDKGGIADFTGYQDDQINWGIGPQYLPRYCACEVKEWHKTSPMPASKLSPEQRAFMSALPPGSAWVGILWPNGAFKVYPFTAEGSYKIDGCTRQEEVTHGTT
jgi:hypothetical protein